MCPGPIGASIALVPVLPSPKVAAVRARLAVLVADLTEGSMLPPERQLSHQWQVSRMTLRRAMDDLVGSGHLERRHGVGTFARRPPVERPLSMSSFTDAMCRRGLTPSTQVLDLRTTEASPSLAALLGTPIGDPLQVFTRLRCADGSPVVWERTTVPAALVPGLTADDLRGSWYDLLAQRYGVVVTSGTTRLEPIRPTAAQAQALEVTHDALCQMATVTARDSQSRPVDRCRSIYRGDRFVITADLT